MEFVACAEISPTFRSRGIVTSEPEGDVSILTLDPNRLAATVDLAPPRSARRKRDAPGAAPETAADVPVEVPLDRVAHTFETVLHKLRLSPLYLVPASRWRNIFDLVASELSENERWQAIDAEAIIEQNTRDPIVAQPGDLHMVRDLAHVLLSAPEVDEDLHALAIVATGPPLVAQVIPGRGVRLLVGNGDLARQASDAANHFLGRTT